MSFEYDVMISYQWDSKKEVIEFENQLKKNNLKVWRDDNFLSSNEKPLTEQLGIHLIYNFI